MYVTPSTSSCSWRHTPLRNQSEGLPFNYLCSWRHTPLRK
ncbi:hypothetical protein J500_1407 [Acinetobacter sp. 479375]|nr:hypothetical protein J500_1407 [Acinetobacter sp. 479375]